MGGGKKTHCCHLGRVDPSWCPCPSGGWPGTIWAELSCRVWLWRSPKPTFGFQAVLWASQISQPKSFWAEATGFSHPSVFSAEALNWDCRFLGFISGKFFYLWVISDLFLTPALCRTFYLFAEFFSNQKLQTVEKS